MTAIKERPILFSAPMVRAILDGRKTVTRRAIKVQPVMNGKLWQVYGAGWSEGMASVPVVPGHSLGTNCPYGQVGDRLWVRESFWHAGNYVQTYPEDDVGSWSGSRRVHYRADGTPPNEPNHHYPNGLRNGSYSAAEPDKIWRPRPSIHMPRWASRILLEITAVRVERLQDISDEQAQAEGCFFTDYGKACFHSGKGVRDAAHCELPESTHQQRNGWMWDKTTNHEQCLGSARNAFGNLWQTTGGDWGANPWVWVVEFERVTP